MVKQILAAATLLVFLSGDVAAASRRWDAGAAPSVAPAAGPDLAPPRETPRAPLRLANPCQPTQPANPCDARRRTPGTTTVPPSVGRDKVDQLLKDRMREEPIPQHPQPSPPVQRAPDTGDDAIRRLGERLRRQPVPPPAVAGTPPGADPG